MTRWLASTKSASVDVAAVFQLVAEMHIIGRPTHVAVGDAFIVLGSDQSRDPGVIVAVPSGHIVMRSDAGRTLHLRPRSGTDPESGFPPPRGKTSSEWVVERLS